MLEKSIFRAETSVELIKGFEEMLHFLNRNDGGKQKRGSLNSLKGKGKHCYQLHLLKKVV